MQELFSKRTVFISSNSVIQPYRVCHCQIIISLVIIERGKLRTDNVSCNSALSCMYNAQNKYAFVTLCEYSCIKTPKWYDWNTTTRNNPRNKTVDFLDNLIMPHYITKLEYSLISIWIRGESLILRYIHIYRHPYQGGDKTIGILHIDHAPMTMTYDLLRKNYDSANWWVRSGYELTLDNKSLRHRVCFTVLGRR